MGVSAGGHRKLCQQPVQGVRAVLLGLGGGGDRRSQRREVLNDPRVDRGVVAPANRTVRITRLLPARSKTGRAA